jgi:hypothetical protein
MHICLIKWLEMPLNYLVKLKNRSSQRHKLTYGYLLNLSISIPAKMAGLLLFH